jgi:linoleoyl-CoA desaturase
MLPMSAIKFKSTQPELSFFDDVRENVASYFTTNNISSKGNAEMIFKCIFWMLFWGASWYAVILFKDIFWLAFAMGLLHMFAHLMIAFNVTHDANHFAMFKNRNVNNFFGYFIELLGSNKRLWMLAHNQEHHTFINIHQHDNNIDGYKLLRLCPHDKWRTHHKWQWLYAPLVYGLSTLNYATFRDFKMLFKYFQNSKLRISPVLVLELIVFKVFYYAYMFAIPVFVFGVSFKLILLYFLVGHFINGLVLVLIFLTGHLTENTTYPLPVNDSVQQSWAVHVINTTGDYAAKTKLMQWFVGGINLHVAHHLFPKICHVHYKNISPIIKAAAVRHGYQYREIPTFWDALKSHFVLLKELSRP